MIEAFREKRKALALIVAVCVLGVAALVGVMLLFLGGEIVIVEPHVLGVLDCDPWSSSDHAYCIPLDFKDTDNEGGFGALSNLRMVVRLGKDTADKQYCDYQDGIGCKLVDYSHFYTDGLGILFMTEGGITVPHHIALWNTNGASYIWIRPATTMTDVHMYYDPGVSTDYEDIAGMWGEPYNTVWLLDETDQVWRDYHDYDNDPYGNFAVADKMGYIAYEAQDFNCPSPGGGGWWGFYSDAVSKTIMAYSGGDNEYFDPDACGAGWYCPCDGFVTYYDHEDSSWATPYKLFEAAAEVHDAHNYPMVVLGGDGYLHAFYAEHATTSVSYTKSTLPITDPSWALDGWEVGTSYGLSATYIYPIVNSEGDIYLFYRKTLETDNVNGSANWYEPQYMLKSTDNGENFTESKVCDPSPDESTQLWNTTYWTYAGIQYTTTPTEGIHVTWDIHGGHNWYMSSTHYAFLSLIDQNGWTEDTWYAADGTNLGATVDYTEQHGSKVQLWTYNEVMSHTNTGRGYALAWDDDGHPNLFTTHRQGEDTTPYFQLEWWVHDGTNWVTSTTSIDTYDTTDAVVPSYVVYNSASDIDLYAEARESMSAYDAWTETRTRAYQGKWHYDGSSWTLEEIVWGKNDNASTNFMPFGPIVDAHPDLQYIIAGRNWLSGGVLEEAGWLCPKERGEIFGWGDQGILKQSTSEESTSPVGMGWHLDGSEDNIFVNHYNVGGASDFAFGDGEITIEALVKFDAVDTLQEIIHKAESGYTGWGLSLDAGAHLDFAVGNGSGWWTIDPLDRDGATVSEKEWHYIVATLAADPDMGTIWLDGVPYDEYHPNWTLSAGTEPLRLGALSDASDYFLDGTIGGYVSICDDVRSNAYIKNSWKNFIDKSLVQYGAAQQLTRGCNGADLDGDGDADYGDVFGPIGLVASWGECGEGTWPNYSCGSVSTGYADIDQNGYVNTGDLSILVSNWGACD